MASLQPEPQRSQSTTSLSQFYNGVNGNGLPLGDEEIHDPKLDFCNAFWGQNERGYDVVMARLRGAGRTVDELRTFWKERAAIEEDYAKRLSKLAKTSLGKDEIGDLKSSLENVLTETAQQASYHLSLSNELRTSVEAPTTEFSARLSNLKKGLQASVEKSYRNKGLQEGHVAKAKERYESDCLKLNSYTANQALTQGKEAEKLQMKLQKVRQTIGQNEQEFRQFVGIFQETSQKWEMEWKGFCDLAFITSGSSRMMLTGKQHVQDLEEDRLALVKDIVWAYANAVSQVCVEDDSSCERIREKLEQFEPINDMVAFVRGWGTGDAIPDPPKFINYSAGEYPSAPTSHPASFHRLSAKPPMSAVSLSQRSAAPELEIPPVEPEATQRNGDALPATNGWVSGMQGLSLKDEPEPIVPAAEPEEKGIEKDVKPPFGGVALPGMASSPPSTATALPKRQSSMPPPPVPPSIPMPEPRVPSRQGPPTPQAVDEEDPMAKALADLRREPPPPASVRRNPSHRRPESVYSTAGSARSPIVGKPASPAPGSNRASFQQAQGVPPAQSRSSIDMGLSPPASGHTAAALARSMDEFQRQSNRQSTNYSAFATDVVGAHPSSRSGSPAPGARAPSPAMMQPPTQPATHIADEVLSQYHQAFPGERSRSRAGSIRSGRSRASSLNIAAPQSAQPGPPSPTPRAGFVGIGAGGGRSPSPQHPAFRSPSPSPTVPQGNLGPQNMGIALDASGGVAQDSMAEAYRRQYQQQQQQTSQQQPGQTQPRPSSFVGSPIAQPLQQYTQQQGYNPQQQQYGQAPKSPVGGPPPVGQRPTSQYGQQSFTAPAGQGQPQPGYGQQSGGYYNATAAPPQPHHQSRPSYSGQQSYQQQQPPVSPGGYGPNGYAQQQQPQQQYGGYQAPAPANLYARSASPAPMANHPAPQHQSQQQAQQYGGYGRSQSPQPGYQQQQAVQRSPSPQPGVPPANAAPTGQWSTTGLPVLFYVKALYDYTALSPAEFDFQQGDIIAVTSTPEDGWWSGELLDEARRVPGRTDFPSNFVCLF
ncbi:hypothetical protein JCM24511_04629 [Saitozyma sp. JCM 24511]|nr:hypothetical protein JCM24511_04629 [Saitozyma sp. JCM 24511]